MPRDDTNFGIGTLVPKTGRSPASTRWKRRFQPNKKAPEGAFRRHLMRHDQCASAQTFFLVKYIRPVKMTRKTKTWNPSRLRASICGSAAHIRNVAMSLEYCSSVAGDPPSYVT